MKNKKRIHSAIKSNLHPRNKHRERYDFDQLIQVFPKLKPFVRTNKYQDLSIDFANPEGVKALNTALLLFHYKLDYWDIPQGFLCPPIPGRADYLHHIADLLADDNQGLIPSKINCLDIGVGANCIYPILGNREYGWSFVGSDIDLKSIQSAKYIINKNSFLKGKIELRHQKDKNNIFKGIINAKESFDLTICNPPFHASKEESRMANQRKVKNLKIKKSIVSLNFGGEKNELWCDGGELKFIQSMIEESKKSSSSVYWFSTLVSKQSNLQQLYSVLKKAEASEVRTIAMGQGNKMSRIIAWTFLNPNQKKLWRLSRW